MGREVETGYFMGREWGAVEWHAGSTARFRWGEALAAPAGAEISTGYPTALTATPPLPTPSP
jgi:hypothetical protein